MKSKNILQVKGQQIKGNCFYSLSALPNFPSHKQLFLALCSYKNKIGVIRLSFISSLEEQKSEIKQLQTKFPNLIYIEDEKKNLHYMKTCGKDIQAYVDISDKAFMLRKKLCQIPWGKTSNYATLAKELSTHPRAVGSFGVGQNEIALLIPCHRVIYSNGKLASYRWGVEVKKCLLELEKSPFKQRNSKYHLWDECIHLASLTG